MIKLLQACLGVAILVVGIMPHGRDDHASQEQDCRSGSKALASAQTTNPSGTTGGSDASTASPSKAHSVRLSWDASVSASNSPTGSIKGYNIYRRDPGKEYEKINLEPIPSTHCVDHSVKAGQTYYYQTVAISAQGTASKPSNTAKATIPAP